MRDRAARMATLGLALLLTVNLAPFAWAAPGDPVAANVRTGATYSTIQAALDAAGPGDTITVVMSEASPAAAYAEALTVSQDGVTLCATTALGTCAPVSAPGRWQASASTIAAPPVQLQGDAIRAPSPGSTSFFATTQDPTSTDKLYVSELEALSFAFLLESGACTGGGVRFQLRLDSDGDGAADKTVFAYPSATFSCGLMQWRFVDVLNGGTWGLSQVGGPGSGATRAEADAFTAGMPITTINLIFDGAPAGSVAWFDNERINDAVFREQVDTTCLDASSPACTTTTARAATILDSPAGATSTVSVLGDGVTLQGFTIRATGEGNVQNVRIAGSGARVLDNVIEGNPLSEVQFGILASGAVGSAWEIAGNTITRAGHTGVYVSGQAPGTIADNLITQNRDNAIYTEGSTGVLTIEGNDLRQAVQANLRVTGTRPMVLRENTFGLSEFTIDFLATDVQVTDARFNDWGAYSRDDIEATINNLGGRSLDISCYYGIDGVAVCPAVADFTFSPNGAHINTNIQFTDASVAGGNAIASRLYTFGDGTTSAAANPTKKFATSGVFAVTLKVTDAEGFVSTATKNVAISNTAPVLAAVADKTASEGALLGFALSATDTDNDALTYSGVSLPAGATVSSGGAFRWTPAYTQAGTYTATVRATDGDLSSSQSFQIVVANVDRAPTLASIADRSVVEDNAVSVALSAADADGDAIALSATGLPAFLTLASNGGTGTLSGTPTVADHGAYTITVTATANGLTATRSFTLTVTGTVALTFSAVGPTVLHSSPGAPVTLTATITNGGSTTDTFNLALTNSRGWASSGPASITLEPGTSATIAATLTPPTKNEKTSISWKATSATSASVTKTIAFSADNPVVLSFELVGVPSAVEGARGLVKATWLDGSPVKNVAVTATQTSTLLGAMTETTTGTTDAMGQFVAVFDDASAGIPGSHTVVVVLNTPLLPKLTTSYEIGGLP